VYKTANFEPLYPLFLLTATFLLLAGCEEAESSWKEKEGSFGVSVTAGEGPKYYSLSTGKEVTGDDINTTAWDIGFERTRQIKTNSGSTAEVLGSGGNGRVWYTDIFGDDFDKVTFEDRKDPEIPDGYDLSVDSLAWVNSSPVPVFSTINVMCYFGYSGGDGRSSDTKYAGWTYSKAKSFLGPEDAASNTYPASKRVFIVRHGDGKHHTKVQIAGYGSLSNTRTDNFEVKFKSLD
jgi:hypothetical protein